MHEIDEGGRGRQALIPLSGLFVVAVISPAPKHASSYGVPTTKTASGTETSKKAVAKMLAPKRHVRVSALGRNTETHTYNDGAAHPPSFRWEPCSRCRPTGRRCG